MYKQRRSEDPEALVAELNEKVSTLKKLTAKRESTVTGIAASISCLIVLVIFLMLGLGLAALVVGILYYTNGWSCEQIPFLSIWLLIFGIWNLFSSIFRCDSKLLSGVYALIYVVLLLIGSVWIFGNDARQNDFAECNETLWKTAFVYVIAVWSLNGAMIVMLLGICCCAAMS